MPVESQTTYIIKGPDFSASFNAPAGLTVEELKTQFTVPLDLSNFSDPDWDSLIHAIRQINTDAKAMPNWATYSAQEAQNAISQAVFSGMDKAAFDAWVDTNVTAANLAVLKASLKNLGEEVINLREIVQKMAMMLVYLRNLTIK